VTDLSQKKKGGGGDHWTMSVHVPDAGGGKRGGVPFVWLHVWRSRGKRGGERRGSKATGFEGRHREKKKKGENGLNRSGTEKGRKEKMERTPLYKKPYRRKKKGGGQIVRCPHDVTKKKKKGGISRISRGGKEGKKEKTVSSCNSHAWGKGRGGKKTSKTMLEEEGKKKKEESATLELFSDADKGGGRRGKKKYSARVKRGKKGSKYDSAREKEKLRGTFFGRGGDKREKRKKGKSQAKVFFANTRAR